MTWIIINNPFYNNNKFLECEIDVVFNMLPAILYVSCVLPIEILGYFITLCPLCKFQCSLFICILIMSISLCDL